MQKDDMGRQCGAVVKNKLIIKNKANFQILASKYPTWNGKGPDEMSGLRPETNTLHGFEVFLNLAQWLGRLPWDPEIPGSRPALTTR